jgi:hypothetical protein
MNPYEAPRPSAEGPSAGRARGKYYAALDGEKLVVQKDAELPSVCLKCGSHDGILRRKAKFQWTPVWARILVPFCWPAGLIAILATTKRGTLDVPLCGSCNARWSQAVGAIVVGVVALVAGIFAIRAFDEPATGFIVFFVALAGFLGLAIGFARPRMLIADKIDEANLTLKGVDQGAAREVVG